jgi:hypothetical protein
MTGSRVLPGLPALAALLVLAVPVRALEVALEASRREVGVGEQLTVSVEVRHDGVGRVPAPQLALPQGLRQVSSYSSQNFSYVNGRATSSLAVQLVLVGEAEGTYTLGPAEVRSGDEVARSNTVVLEVKPAGSSAGAPRFGGEESGSRTGNDLVVLGQVDDPEPWVNQQVTYTFTFLRRVRLLGGTQYTPPATTGFWVEELDTSEPREVVLEGRRYVAERVRLALFPTGPGEHTVGEAYLRATVPDARRGRRDPFDLFGADPFGVFGGGREVVLKADAIPVRARALPETGKPADFCGAVGSFALAAEVDQRTVRAGDAVTLRVKLSGEGNVKVVAAPDLSGLSGFKIYESKSDEASRALGDRIRGEKTWEYVLVPTSGGEVEIPALRMSYFDPAQAAYVSLATDAIPLDVEATALDEALARGGDASIAKERVRLRERDIRYVKPAPARLRREGAEPWRDPVLLLAQALPALAFAGSVAVRRHRDRLRSDRRYARRRGAGRAAGRRLDVAGAALRSPDLEAVFAQTSAALRGYVADRLHLAAANLDERAVRAGLEGLGSPPEEIEALFAMLAACDGARFSPLGSDRPAAGELVERARRWIGQVERR